MRAPWSRTGGRTPPSADTHVPWRGLTAVGATLAVLVVAVLPSPYAIERPGPVYDTLGANGSGSSRAPLVDIPGRTTYPTSGRLDLLTVSVLGAPGGGPSWLELTRAWLDPAQAVVPLEAVIPAGVSEQESERQSAAEMSGSQRSATAAALAQLGYRVDGDVRIGSVGPGTAAAGVLRAGDLVRSFDGDALTDSCALQDAVLEHGARAATIVVERDGAARTLRVTPRAVDAGGGTVRPLLGVTTTASFRFPFAVRLRIDDVGGPSAGMMFALAIVDKLTPGALTGGRHVAGTGTICGDGSVGPIGGIVQKMHAARAAGATLFLAPADNCDEVVGHVPDGLSVVPVETLSGALDVLKTVGRSGSAAGMPGCAARIGSPT